MARVVVVGQTTRDVVDGALVRPGGAPLYCARALAACGADGHIVTRCGKDDEGLLEALAATGVPFSYAPGRETAAFRLENAGDERLLHIDRLGERWTPEDVARWAGAALDGAAWVHAGALWRGEFPPETLAALARGRRLSLDGQGLTRPGRLGPVRLEGTCDRAGLDTVGLLHLSEVEAAALGLALEAGSLASLDIPEVVVTLGARGAIVVADGRLEHVAAVAIRGIDQTGAGDMFMGAYIASRDSGDGPREAAERATGVVHHLLAGSRP